MEMMTLTSSQWQNRRQTTQLMKVNQLQSKHKKPNQIVLLSPHLEN